MDKTIVDQSQNKANNETKKETATEVTTEEKVVKFPAPKEKPSVVAMLTSTRVPVSYMAAEIRTVVNRKAKERNWCQALTNKGGRLLIKAAKITTDKETGIKKLVLKLLNLDGVKLNDIEIDIDDNGEAKGLQISETKSKRGYTGIIHDRKVMKTGFNPAWME